MSESDPTLVRRPLTLGFDREMLLSLLIDYANVLEKEEEQDESDDWKEIGVKSLDLRSGRESFRCNQSYVRLWSGPECQSQPLRKFEKKALETSELS